MKYLSILFFLTATLPLLGSGPIDTITTTLNITICAGETFEGYTQSGSYIDIFHLENGDDSIRILNLTVLAISETSISRWICRGDTVEGYTLPPFVFQLAFIDTLISVTGCDSIRILYLALIPDCVPIISFDLNACEAHTNDGTNMDYSEFTATYPVVLEKGGFPCIEMEASLFRDPPQENKHSCTPGIHQSKAMCVSSYDSCVYAPGHEASVVIEIDVSQVVSLMYLSGIEFYSKAPTIYDWIDGSSGLNNYPQRYGLRILNNNIEVFRRMDIPTTQDWTLQTFAFAQFDPLPINTFDTYRIELLPYCLIGNGSAVSAWDIDEIRIFAGCVPLEGPEALIFGNIQTPDGSPLADAQVSVSQDLLFSNAANTYTDEEGYYTCTAFDEAGSYYLRAVKDGDYLEGVSILDLLQIQKHLLGIQPFTSVYQYIAADIDRNEVVNVSDLLELRKLQLGIHTSLPRNTSWRIGTLPLNYSGTAISAWQETETIDFNGADAVKVDWIAVKVGNVIP